MASAIEMEQKFTSLVTGADGFTGRYLSRALAARGHRVIGLTHAGSPVDGLLCCDLTDAEGTKSIIRRVCPDYVVHLAAMSFVGEADYESFYRVNLFGTLNLLEAIASCDKAPVKILIASSANVYGDAGDAKIEETTCPAPRNHYANSKLAMENMVRLWFEKFPIIITRPFNYTGPGQSERFLVPKVVAHFRRRSTAIALGNIDVSRDYSDVRDVVASYVALLESRARSEIVNICSGKLVSIRDVLAMLSCVAGYDIKVEVDPLLVRSNDVYCLVGSSSKLEQMTGIKPRLPLSQTLQDMYLG